MDRSFLSDTEVIAASRDFVCVRLATFENAAENDFTQSLYRTRRNRQVNTVFTILAPDGKTALLTPGRSVSHTLGSEDPQKLVAAMKRIADRYKTKGGSRTPPIPYGIDLRRALNIASCDLQPLVVVVAGSEAKRKAIEKTLTPLAWSPKYVGVFAYATAEPDELKALAGAKRAEGVLVVHADRYGLTGKVVASATGTSASTLKAALKKGLDVFKPAAKDSIQHIREARRRGIEWESDVEHDSRPRR